MPIYDAVMLAVTWSVISSFITYAACCWAFNR
jgi:hypothetical protein